MALRKFGLLFAGLILFPFVAGAADLDSELKTLTEAAEVKALPQLGATGNRALYDLGRNLFFDKILSGNKNISCSGCHSTAHGTADGRSFPTGTGGAWIARSAPPLFNLSASVPRLFWDGRVSAEVANGHTVFSTPESGLNGRAPLFSDLTAILAPAGPLAAQILFPIANNYEMKGDGYNSLSNYDYWNEIIQRILAIPEYKRQFEAAFPLQTKFNLAHASVAISEFVQHAFSATETPFDQYLRGKLDAMNDSQKRGAIVFFGEKAKCAQCHKGPDLTDFKMKNVGIPQVGPGTSADGEDYGYSNTTGSETDHYKFRTTPLRNIGATAPYMHDGTLRTLREVVTHYNDVFENLFNKFNPSDRPEIDRLNYDKTKNNDIERFNSMEVPIRSPLGLSEDEVHVLIDFLETGLTDQQSLNNLPALVPATVPSGLPVE